MPKKWPDLINTTDLYIVLRDQAKNLLEHEAFYDVHARLSAELALAQALMIAHHQSAIIESLDEISQRLGEKE